MLGGKIIPNFKLTIDARVDGLAPHESIRAGDLLTVDVICERLAHYDSQSSRANCRVYMALVNYATDQVVLEEVSVEEMVTSKTFKLFLRERGRHTFRVYVFSGDG